MQNTSELDVIADEEGFIVVYPDASPGGWNIGDAYSPDVDDVGFISALIDTLSRRERIDTLRIYVTGFSLGGMMSYRLAAELSERIAAVAPVAGQWLPPVTPERGVPIIQFQDVFDPNVPFEGDSSDAGFLLPSVEAVIDAWIGWNGCHPEPDTIYNQDGIIGRRWLAAETHADIILFTLTQGGHYWPKGDFPADDFIWEFFVSHPLRQATPAPCFAAEQRTGHAPLTVRFTDVSCSLHPLRSWSWDFEHDGIMDSHEQNPLWTFEMPGVYTVSLTVSTDSSRATAQRQQYIHVFAGESCNLFNGINSRIYCPAVPGLNLTGPVTIEAWINPAGWGEFPKLGLAKIIDKGALSLCLVDDFPPYQPHSLLLSLTHKDGRLSHVNSEHHAIHLNSWQHVAVTYNGNGTVTMLANGADMETFILKAPSGPVRDNCSEDLFIGNANDLGGTFNGMIDEVRIWNVVRSQKQIRQYMDRRLCGTETDLVGCWPLDEGCGDTTADCTMGGHKGVIVESMWREGAPLLRDHDEDGIGDCADNCWTSFNPDQRDADLDGAGDTCDNCPGAINPDQMDADDDGTGNACDSCTDTDGDGFGDPEYPGNICEEDNCPLVFNPDQSQVKRGDIDCIGGTDVLDALHIINHILQTVPLQGAPLRRADCRGDGQVDVLDLLGVVNVILERGTCTE